MIRELIERLDYLVTPSDDWVGKGTDNYPNSDTLTNYMSATMVQGSDMNYRSRDLENPGEPDDFNPEEYGLETEPAEGEEIPQSIPNDDLSHSFAQLLSNYGIKDISVQVEDDGEDYIVTFMDDDGDTEVIVFSVDPDDGAFAIVDSQNANEDDDALIVDLEFLDPNYTKDGRLNLINPSWITKSTILSLLDPLDSPDEEVETNEALQDLRSRIAAAKGRGKQFTGKTKMVVRGGRIMKVPVFIRVRKVRLSPRQMMALRKARMKAHSARAMAKRARSFKRGEMMHYH